MTDPFCPETGPDGELCGVAANIVHSRHFTLTGSTWETSEPHRPPVQDARDWLHKELHLDHDSGPGVELTEFRHLLHEYEMRRSRQLWNPPQTLALAVPEVSGGGGTSPLVLRPCHCCRCTGGTVCFHPDQGGCMWPGPGR
jgi:hypothetical protein